MNDIISYCGINCSLCPAFTATASGDAAARESIAREWSKQYGADIKADDIYCKGCLNEEGRIFGHCQVCDIRKCARERKAANCAVCGDYACAKLEDFFKIAPQCRAMLDSIRRV